MAPYFSLLFSVTAEHLRHFHLSHLSLEAEWIYGLILQKLPLLGKRFRRQSGCMEFFSAL